MNLGPVELLIVLAILAIPLLFAWLTGRLAADKGYSFGTFFVIGLFGGVIGLVVAAVLPQRAVAPAVPPPAPLAGWHPDPTQRFELRYHDGTRWTEHVARGGVQSTDPL